MIASEEELSRLKDVVLDPATDREEFEDAMHRIRELERTKTAAE